MGLQTEENARDLGDKITVLINHGLEDDEIWDYIRYYPDITYPKMIAVIRLLLTEGDSTNER